MIWSLLAISINTQVELDIRYREYTRSEKRARLFQQIPDLHPSNTDERIHFIACPVPLRAPRIREKRLELADYVKCEMDKLREKARRKPGPSGE